MSNYVKKYNTGNIMVDLPYDSYIHELPLISFCDFRNSVNLSLVYNHKLKLDSNNMFNITNGYKLNIQKRIVIDDSNNPIKFIDANGKQISLVKNYNSLNQSSQFNGGYTFDDKSKRVLRSTSTGYEIEHDDLSKEEYNLAGYITKSKDKYGDTYLSYNYNSNNNLSSVTYNGKTIYFGYFLNQLNYIEYGNTEITLEYNTNKITVYHYSGVTFESTLTGNNYKIEAKANEGTNEVSYSKTCEYDDNKMIIKSKMGPDVIDNIEYIFPYLILGNYSSFKQVEIKNKRGVTQRIQFEDNKPTCMYDVDMTSTIDLSNKYYRNVNIYKIMNEDIDNKFNGALSYKDGNFMTKDNNNPTFYEADITGNVNKKGKYIVTGWLKSTIYNSNNTIFISDVTDQTGINFYVSTPELNKWYFFAYQFEINVNTVKVYCPFAGVELGDLRLTYYSYESLDDLTNSGSIYTQDILINKSNGELFPFKDVEFYYATESEYSGCIKMTFSDVLRYYNRKIKYGLVNELYYNDGKNVITDLLRINVKPKGLDTYYSINDFHIGYRYYKNGNEFKTKLEIDDSLNEPFKINNYKNSNEYSEQLLNEDFDVVEATEDNITTNFTRDKGLITRETIEGLSNISYTYNTNTLVVKDDANNNYLYDGVTYYADSTWGTIYKTEYSDGIVLEDTFDDDKTSLIKKRFLKGSNVIENNFGYSKSRLSSLNNNGLSYDFTYSKDKLSNVTKFGSDIIEQVNTDVSDTIYFPNKDNYTYYDQLIYDQYYRLSYITNKMKYTYSNEGLIEKIEDEILDLTHHYNYNNKGIIENSTVISSNDPLDFKSVEGFVYDKENRLTSKEFVYSFATDDRVKDEIEYVKKVEEPYIDERVSNSKYYIDNMEIVTTSSEYDDYKRLKVKSYKFNKGTSVKTYGKTNNYYNNRINQEITNLSNITSNVIQYTYDNFDRISHVQNVNKLTSYQYDDFGRLTRENNEALDKTIVYEYNDIGNITSRKIYDYTIATTPTTLLSTIPYEYDTTQKDRLISYNNITIPYDVLGCPTKLNDYNLTWSKGKLVGLNKGSLQTETESYTYTYNAYGQRVSKTYNKMAGTSGITQIQPEEVVNRSTQFNYDHFGRLINEIILNTCYNGNTFSKKLEYIYDVNTIIGMKYTNGTNSNIYYFERNMLGDVLGIYDLNGNLKVKYLYDAYGNCTVSSETTDQELAKVNPIRYRGYYYDVETGLFYCNSRYYSSEWGRWISPDDIEYLDPESINGLNLYCYCFNNPVMCRLGYNLGGGILVPTSNIGSISSNISSRSRSGSAGSMSRASASTTPFANVVSMTNYSTTLVDNILFGMALGNISHTTTIQHNNSGVFYAYSNIGNSTSSVGVGLNIKDWYGLNAYVSSNIGIGSSMQLGSITFGAEVSVLDGVSFSFGTVTGNVTNETTVSIGWGTLAFAYAACGAIAATPVPFARVAAGVAVCVVVLIDIFN